MTFEITPREARTPHLPMPLLDGSHSSIDLESIVEPRRHEDYDHMWEPDQEMVGSYFLPPFQRPAVWTDAQKERFVESAHLGIPLGSIVIVDAMNLPMPGPERYAATDRWLIDGQQRCRALIDYRNDAITVLRGTPCEHRWSDLTERERRRFHRIQIGVIRIETDDVGHCREIYDRMNFGGTAHTQDQRATRDDRHPTWKPSDEGKNP